MAPGVLRELNMKRTAWCLLAASSLCLQGCDTVHRYVHGDPAPPEEPTAKAQPSQPAATNAPPSRPGERWYPPVVNDGPKVTIIPMMATPAPNPSPPSPPPKDQTPIPW
jgi:hypothetical protein